MLHYDIVGHKVLLMARELGLGGTERQLAEIALSLRERIEPASDQRFRLAGVGLNNFQDAERLASSLFD